MSKFETVTDTFHLNNTNLFDKIRECLPDDLTFTQNLIECKDDLLFVWNAKECYLLTLNWRAARVKGDLIKYQTLIPSTPQNYVVDRILPSYEANFVALSGKHGVSILELPRRWGPNGQYHDGKEQIICRSYNLDESFFIHNEHIEVLQTRWHPASPSDSHLFVLLSDNYIRVYNESKLKHAWRIGPIPSAKPPTDSAQPFLNSLGDTAVDFDIGPARVVTWNDDGISINSSQANESATLKEASRVIWPILILRGNGSIYILCAGIDSEKPHLQGPIKMIPSAPDNYGLDYCALSVIPTLPPTIVIAENSGRLHHALLMDIEGDAETSTNEIDSSIQIYPSEWILNVLEIVQLELGLLEPLKPGDGHSCPIHLKRDLINEYRYYAYHNTGLHAITINFIKELQIFLETENQAQPPVLSVPSKFEYIVCTKAMNSNQINPVLGLTFFQSPAGLVLLLGSGQIVSLDLISDTICLRELKSSLDTNQSTTKQSQIRKILNESFLNQITNILKSGTHQPILKLNKDVEPTPEESFELLIQATQILREQHFPKFDKARHEFQKRVKILQRIKNHQQQQIEQLNTDKEMIRENAERLADIYEETSERQQILFKKAMELVRIASSALPVLSASEKDYCNQIKKINNLTKELAKKIDLTKANIQAHDGQMDAWNKNTKGKQVTLPPKQEEMIKEIIMEVSKEVEEQIKEVKKLNQIVNVS